MYMYTRVVANELLTEVGWDSECQTDMSILDMTLTVSVDHRTFSAMPNYVYLIVGGQNINFRLRSLPLMKECVPEALHFVNSNSLNAYRFFKQTVSNGDGLAINILWSSQDMLLLSMSVMSAARQECCASAVTSNDHFLEFSRTGLGE